MSRIPQYVLVTPVWNDSERLKIFGRELANSLKEAAMDVTWVIADDGSSEEEYLRLEGLQRDFSEVYPNLSLIRCDQRSRKGGAIRAGWDVYSEAGFYCFVDGDGAIGAEVMIELMRKAAESACDEISIVGVRHSDSSENRVHRTWLRQLIFRGFSSLMHCLLKEPWLDTQCGAKVIHGDAYRAVRASLVETGFVFDAELLTHLSYSGYDVREVPIPWDEVPGSKLSLISDSWRILMGLVRIRSRLRKLPQKSR